MGKVEVPKGRLSRSSERFEAPDACVLSPRELLSTQLERSQRFKSLGRFTDPAH